MTATNAALEAKLSKLVGAMAAASAASSSEGLTQRKADCKPRLQEASIYSIDYTC